MKGVERDSGLTGRIRSLTGKSIARFSGRRENEIFLGDLVVDVSGEWNDLVVTFEELVNGQVLSGLDSVHCTIEQIQAYAAFDGTEREVAVADLQIFPTSMKLSFRKR